MRAARTPQGRASFPATACIFPSICLSFPSLFCRLAAYIANREMAPLADFKKQCHWCYQKHNCALYHRVREGVDGGVGAGRQGGGQAGRLRGLAGGSADGRR